MIGRVSGNAGPLRSEPLAAWGFLLAPMAAAALLLGWPRPVTPELLPTLRLPAAQVAGAIAQDARDAAHAPRGPLADELRQLLAAQGEAEVQGSEQADLYSARRELLAARCRALVATAGEPAARALRAEAVLQMEEALAGQLPMEQARVVLGAMPSVLEREGAAVDGTLLPAHFVLRTLYKARINLLFGRKPHHDLARIEQQAFFGYQALHDARLPVLRRVEALKEYAKAGGVRADEALGALLHQNRQWKEAAEVLRSTASQTGELRARNYALAAEQAARRVEEDTR